MSVINSSMELNFSIQIDNNVQQEYIIKQKQLMGWRWWVKVVHEGGVHT
jgi:hypothetical protein